MGGAQNYAAETEAGSSCWLQHRWEAVHPQIQVHQQYQTHFQQPGPMQQTVAIPAAPQHHQPQLQQPQHHVEQQQQQQQYHFHSRSSAVPARKFCSYTVPGDPMITSSLKDCKSRGGGESRSAAGEKNPQHLPRGKQGKDIPEEKKDDGELWGNVEAQAAFLGPNLWDKTLPYDADLKVLNHYVDLDEFLSENGIPVDGVTGGGQGPMPGSQLHKMNAEAGGHQGPAGLHLEVTKSERSPSPSECCSPDTLNPPSPADSTVDSSSTIQFGLSLVALSMASSGRDFDPRTRAFSDEELKPQPMVKKSRKQDDKYWARRRKNNMAAKRSRDARRMKQNQIALRAGFLEKENMGLRQELDRLKNENILLRDKLSKYTDV
ncbi:thyrotroph embryonic factor isoform X3 [Neodiprion pinetum]|uniref:thyrotroph embryonic factor isoform X3 n=1 Tax=Neodiprion fabricii TaxID=2872261 RepID=UPI001ED96B66|nr:thyrotroph embryonic factor isoform X3 [Neodiprion fabricii]XP_046492096.1 thyrotroph embryonic factor isoform X3 [Neodiprion pinetum]